MIQYLTSAECRRPEILEKQLALARKKFQSTLLHDLDEKALARLASPHTLSCAAYDTEMDQVASFFVWTVTDTRFRDGLLAGELMACDLHTYDGSHPPVLFFNTFVVTSSYHAPYIIRHLTKDLHALIQADELEIAGGLSIAKLRFTQRWLRRFGFSEIGKYDRQYPILWARRDESTVLNTLVKVY